MAAYTAYAQNRIIDAVERAQALGAPATKYLGLHTITGAWIASTAYALGAYVTPAVGNGRLYKCTTAGTTGAAAPTWPTTAGGTVTDGTVVWTEQTTAMVAGQFPPEVALTGGTYNRVAVAASLANFSGTQGAGTVVASQGTAPGLSSNNSQITWPAPGTLGWGTVGLVTVADAGYAQLAAPITALSTTLSLTSAFTPGPSGLIQVGAELMTVTAGNGTTALSVTRGAQGTTAAAASSGTAASGAIWSFEVMTNPQVVSNGSGAPSIQAGQLGIGPNNSL